MNTMVLKHIYWKLVPYRIRDYIAYLSTTKYKKEVLKEVEQKLMANSDGGEKANLLELKENIIRNMRAYNYNYAQEFKLTDYKPLVKWDKKRGFYYVERNNRKLYIKRYYNTAETAALCYMHIRKEQHPDSPHCYVEPGTEVKGDVLIDAGAAEGFFALDYVDNFSKIFLVECDEMWIEALNLTFQDEIRDGKVVVINKFLSDRDDETCATIDSILNTLEMQYHDITLKMDIEGAEASALRGAEKLLNSNKNVSAYITTYHKPEDELLLQKFFCQYDIAFSKGYMIFFESQEKRPFLRKGIMRAKKI